MSHPDLVTDPAGTSLAGDLAPDDPFTSLRYHFGMLLGVDDFETEQAYHRGKLRLHQGWLHGAGIVWGLAVAVDEARSEVRVEPGLAVDGAGRELHLDGPACLDPGAWFDRHASEVQTLEPTPDGADVAFDAHVEIRWATCLTRPVPALADPCTDAGVETAHSRIWETVELRLVPGPAPERPDRYRRLRVLLGLAEPGEDPGGQEAAQARADVLATGEPARSAAVVAALRAMANADAIDLAPPEADDGPRALTPEAAPAGLVLAELRGLALRRRPAGGWELVGGEVDLGARRSHVATQTAQELAAAALLRDPAGAPGPAIAGVTRTGAELVLALTAPLDERSVQPAAFVVSSLGAGGWEDVAVAGVTHDPAAPQVTLALAAEPAAPWRVVARGTGAAPLVGADLAPLGGGRDFEHLERS